MHAVAEAMQVAEARYVIFMNEVMLTAPLEDGDLRYLTTHIIPNLRPLSSDEYIHGPAVLLQTVARYSYVLYQSDVYWCADWEPGLIVVQFTPGGPMAWAALRSPIPNFGGRTADPQDLRHHDEDAVNHPYNLVFTAWDAQFDEAHREWRSFMPAVDEAVSEYKRALAHADRLGAQLWARYCGDDKFSAWSEQCKRNLHAWAGEGIWVK